MVEDFIRNTKGRISMKTVNELQKSLKNKTEPKDEKLKEEERKKEVLNKLETIDKNLEKKSINKTYMEKGEEKKMEAKKNVKKDGTFEGVNTNLISKNFSPMIIRKYNAVNGWPTYIGIIADCDLSDLDDVFNKAIDVCVNIISRYCL
jgi:flagellar biosynthesis/type III secretory pathway protein FliH